MRAPAFLLSSAERRVALFYFTTMMPLGAAVVQAGVWFAENGISGGGIGVINALPVLIGYLGQSLGFPSGIRNPAAAV